MIEILKNQLRLTKTLLLVIFFFVILILGFVGSIHFYLDIPLNQLTGDLAVIGELPIYSGILSQMGLFLWFSTAAICFYSLQFVNNKMHKTFIKVSAFITLFLAFDDAFMFHEILFPSIGIHQKVVFLGYGLLMAYYILRYYKLLLTTRFLLFIIAIGNFGLSLLIDNFLYNETPYITALGEDGFKFIGISFWLGFFVTTTRQMINSERLKTS